ncbi:MAG TPA: D-2-hydroxyacid dehydrogenase family protein [Trebonia sp.]|jgi:phosphoglycerate dehydrogenase-like enzyme
MALIQVAILDDYQDAALRMTDWSAVTARADLVVFRDHVADQEELIRRLRGFDVVVVMRERTPLPAAVIGRLPRLKLVVTSGSGNAVIDLAAAARHGITVCGTGGSGLAAPELSWGLLMALFRDIPGHDASVRAGGWQRGVGRELAGATLGLLGLGRIGQRMARYAHAFDMRVIAWSEHLTDDTARAHGAELVTREQLFAQADAVSVHLKLSGRTAGLVGAAELKLLGPDGYLVNTSRSGIVDRAALVDALRERTIAGAALDVFDIEPLSPGDPLRTLPGTVLTPHVGYVTTKAYQRFFSEIAADIVAWLDGAPVRRLGCSSSADGNGRNTS